MLHIYVNLTWGLGWPLIFGTSILITWQARNELIFQQKNANGEQLLHRILGQANATAQSLKDHKRISAVQRSDGVHWKRPAEGWCKLNCDGAVNNIGAKAGCGGVLRDNCSRFHFGYSAKLVNCSIVEVELWVILKGLRIAREKGFHNLLVETDSLNACNILISGHCSVLHPCFYLVRDIRELMDLERNWSVEHINRKANKVAYILAKFGMDMNDNCIIF